MATERGPAKHLNLNVRGMGNSATVAINDRSNALRAAGRNVHKLGLGQSPFPVPEPVVEALRRHAAEKDYLPTQGLRELRRAVAGHTTRTTKVERDADDVLVGPGSKELMFLLQLVYYGDLVIPTPAWVSYAPQAKIIGRQVRLIGTQAQNGWRMTPADFERLCREDEGRPRIVILNYPSNPTGGTYAPEDLEALARIAKDHRVLMLSDEIYGELHHEGQHVSIARYYPEGTIISSGLSKWCGAGGWRLGTFVFPPELAWLRQAMTAAASETYTSVSAPIQYAGVAAFDPDEEIGRYLETSRRVLRLLGRWVHETLGEASIDALPPAGAFYLFPDFSAHREKLAARGITDSPTLTERLLEDTGVAILPGTEFGRPGDELTVRLAYVDFDGAAALAAADDEGSVDPAFAETRCPSVVEAIRKMCDWAAG